MAAPLSWKVITMQTETLKNRKPEKAAFKRLDNFIFFKMAETKLPGLSIAIIKENQIIYNKGFGFRDLLKGESTTPNTLYCIGSVTKSITSIAVMQLQERGLLDIDEQVDSYLPFSIRPKGQPIKIRHLMNHTSGIPALAYAEAAFSLLAETPSMWLPISNVDGLMTFLHGVEGWAEAKPGERWFYLNEGYILLGSLIEEVSGLKYPEYMKKNILEPLEMWRSYFLKEDVDNDIDVATPYASGSNGEREPSNYIYGDLISDGGLISSVMDIINFVKMLLNQGSFKGRTILTQNSISQIMKPQIKIPDEPVEGDSYLQYGFGIIVKHDFLGRTLYYHSGSVWVSTAYIGLIPEEGIGVVVLANGTGYPLNYIGEYALALMLGENPMRIPALRRQKILDSLTGVYETYMGTMNFKVTRKGGLLQMEMYGGSHNLPLIPELLEGKILRFHVLTLDRRIPIEFYRRRGETYMLYERYKLRKSSKL